jgi:hypothetical protein
MQQRMAMLKKILLPLLAALSLLLARPLLAQTQKPKQRARPNSVPQADTARPKGFYAAQAYFYGNGKQYVTTQDFLGLDLNEMLVRIDSASKGANVAIDNLRFVDANGKITMITKIPYQFNRPPAAVTAKSDAVSQVEALMAYRFVSGTIYFSGFGHRNISMAKASDTASLKKYCALSGPGTTITLDNCVYKNADGS